VAVKPAGFGICDLQSICDNKTERPMSVTLHTELGDVKIELNCSEVKKSNYNFLALCASGYYDNTLIHRNIKGFMVQMGDPTGTGKGGLSYSIPFGGVKG
jgi:Cyclophilin type peptidyl-prolyl cis-trans isomerase/CLD